MTTAVPPLAVPPRDVAAAVLASLPGMTTGRLGRVLGRWPCPQAALRALAAGRAGEALDDRAVPAVRVDALAAATQRMAITLARRGTRVLLAGEAGFPIDDAVPGRPPILFVEGNRPDVLDGPRVAVVGTRAATPHGLADARELGAYLAVAGVTVVSGLAIGVDAAAHVGALSAGDDHRGGPIGVVATGLDVVYPRRHTVLYDRVRRRGLLVGEQPFGIAPGRSRFPVRNRIIAALADLVVVVEATLHGGSRITAERALDYGRPVFAVPGSRRNPAAAGCNALLADGAQPLLDPSDLLVALGMTPGARRGWSAPAAKPSLSSAGQQVMRALAGEPAHPDELATRTGLDHDELAVAIEELIAAGSVERARGFIWPR